jgi:hypothetical protein
MMKRAGFHLFAIATIAAGCAQIEQPRPPADMATSHARGLGFTMRLVDGNPKSLPPSVAAALSDSSQISVSYRENLTHDESHTPLWESAIDPSTYSGATLGARIVDASAELRVFEGDKTLGDYTASAHVQKTYSMFHQPSNVELEETARAEVRRKIDDQLVFDAPKIAGASAVPAPR